ncbi:MAG: uroporphyrinogen-III C-methyltransferase [Deltaproteobacteria bacterium]|nr:uroporphyrinogen-III C-methyltransferase [Deltaproteobacteria bacterium]MBW1958550.1 uroporphyrinogen-III C-methyltransferase [Deltaproteobacteria bacterium]MBW2013392.1 uroporphyrinogen-III C-methyltransferase [Deltaproteobacteria bacterium]MBW2087425.1 uroporphyrinogen-III C-methyltransferase [Deltaproteobacteria bacterium]MBW2319862.1 uroporphyrinogen-III C-methyltransferase [Deltaproteobacteria bacterium]
MKIMKGKVYLVGAGPGDPGLITVKGLECIKNADVLIYDYLASPVLLKHAQKHAEILYVGKKGGDHTLSQDEINTLIAEKAQKGLTVTRLKGGDPFIFGRGGEEAEMLIKNDIPFEIVPGVTSAIAAPAYAGIPLTHRKFTSTVAFVTGHEDPLKEESSIDWAALAKGIGTLVFLMGVKNLPFITHRLIHHGMDPDTPVALIRWGTTPRQITVTGTLHTISERAKDAGFKPPAIIVVGHVVKLREILRWFENRPLMGLRIVVTRAREQASELVERLSDLGAECLEYPTITVVPPDDFNPLDTAIQNLSTYEWLVFTSVNGVNFFFNRLYEKNKDVRALRNVNTAVIGPATAKRLFDFGLHSDIVPESYRAESIIKAFAEKDINGKKILLPRAKEARPILPIELTRMGAIVDEVTAYCTRSVQDKADLLLKRLKEKTIDLITFTSSSTVKNFHALLPPEDLQSLMQEVRVASIGPITADTARNLGFDIHIIAESYTIPGLCEAIKRHYGTT